jgi:hypothetical protein
MSTQHWYSCYVGERSSQTFYIYPEKLAGRHHRDIGYSTRESVSDFKDHIGYIFISKWWMTEQYSWYMKNTFFDNMEDFKDIDMACRRRLYAHRQYDRFNRYLRYSVPLLSTCDRIYEEVLRWRLVTVTFKLLDGSFCSSLSPLRWSMRV